MSEISTSELQEIKNLNNLYFQGRKLDECYKRFLELQTKKQEYGFLSSWQSASQRYKISEESKQILVDLDRQEEEFIQIFREDILKKLSIQNPKDDSIQWKRSEYFEIKDIENINNTNPNFFPTIKKYSIRFENCSFVGDKISQNDSQSHFFYQLNYSAPIIDFPLFFNECQFFNFVNLHSIEFQKSITFSHCDFLEGVNFGRSTFQESVFFQDTIYKKQSDFSECIFKKRSLFYGNRTLFESEANFLNTTFLGHASFRWATFEGKANFSIVHQINQDTKGFKDYADFSKACFKKRANFNCNTFFVGIFKEATFENNTIFAETLFLKNVDFSNAKFLGETTFKDAKIGKEENIKSTANFSSCIFSQEIDFSSTFFYSDTYFHRTVFHQNIQFYRSYFEGIANFYFVDFQGIPNFSMCVFNQPKFVNFVGVVLPQNTIDKLRDYINQKAGKEAKEKSNREKGRTRTYLCIQHSLNIRDSFRVIKETLIAQGNLLDTQQWHKLELYAKELECEYRDDISALSQEINKWVDDRKREKEEEQKEKNKLKEEKQKKDLEKQGVSIEVVENLEEDRLPNPKDTDSMKILEVNKNELSKNRIEFWQLWFYRLTSDHHTNLAQIMTNIALLVALFGIFSCGILSLKPTTNILNPKIEGVSIVSQLKTTSYFFSEMPNYSLGLMLVSLSIVFFCGIYSFLEFRRVVCKKLFGFKIVDLLFLTIIIGATSFQLYEGLFTGFVCFSFIGFYFFFSQRNNLAICIFSYMVCAGILFFSPTLLIPFVGALFSEGFKTNIPTMQSLSVVYCILMFLMLFSLKKTAQKNSIIPS